MDNPIDTARTKLLIRRHGSASWISAVLKVSNVTSRLTSFHADLTIAGQEPPGWYDLRLEAVDLAGNEFLWEALPAFASEEPHDRRRSVHTAESP